MKHKPMSLSLVLASLCLAGTASATLSGTYTINPGGTASSTNYQTLTSALSDLTAGTRADGGTPNGSGVSGPVILGWMQATPAPQRPFRWCWGR